LDSKIGEGYMQGKSSFHEALCEKIFSSMSNNYGSENWDKEVLGKRQVTKRQVLKERMTSLINPIISKTGLKLCETDFNASRYRKIINNYGAGLEDLFGMLSDDHSRNTLVEVIAFRILGYRHVRLSCIDEQYWKMRKKASSLPHDMRGITPPLSGKATSFYDIRGLDLPFTVYGYPPSITHTFLMKHYTYDNGDRIVGVSEGDCIIDAGACWGDTALLFAHESGPSGRVHSFEFEKTNLKLLEEVLNLNPDYANRISVIQKALWSKSGQMLSFNMSGPGTRVSTADQTKDRMQVESISIDDLSEEVGKIDFIKMDIEGAELEAMKGAARTITQHRPKLAISLYHNLSDFITIPAFLRSLDVSYDYYLKHPTTYDRETVLFASPR
jgi:FkbM family methyltransferase